MANNFLFGKGMQELKAERFGSDQLNVLRQLTEALQQLFGQQQTGGLESMLTRKYYSQQLPQIQEQFASTGSLRSSAYKNALAQSAMGLEERLGLLRGMRSQQQLGQGLGLGLTPRHHLQFSQAQPGMIQSLLGSLLPGLLQQYGRE